MIIILCVKQLLGTYLGVFVWLFASYGQYLIALVAIKLMELTNASSSFLLICPGLYVFLISYCIMYTMFSMQIMKMPNIWDICFANYKTKLFKNIHCMFWFQTVWHLAKVSSYYIYTFLLRICRFIIGITGLHFVNILYNVRQLIRANL